MSSATPLHDNLWNTYSFRDKFYPHLCLKCICHTPLIKMYLSCDNTLFLQAASIEGCPFVHLESVVQEEGSVNCYSLLVLSDLCFATITQKKKMLPLENGYSLLKRNHLPGTQQSYAETSVPKFLLYLISYKSSLIATSRLMTSGILPGFVCFQL